ncbi:hypothetical protein Q7P37_000764 [Cladosporium fusiforme]
MNTPKKDPPSPMPNLQPRSTSSPIPPIKSTTPTTPATKPATTRPSGPPPPTALPLLAKAHILLHSQADLTTETEFGSIAACGIMVYGIIQWRWAEHRVRLEMLDEAEREERFDEEDGDGVSCRASIAQRAVGIGKRGAKSGRADSSKEVISRLVQRAVGDVKEWDREVGLRLEFALREVVWARWCVEGRGIRMPL